MLEGKNAILYGVSDSLGGAVAKAFARHGAAVWLTSLDLAKSEKIADEILSAGGKAQAARVDALDEHAVQEHMDAFVADGHRLDISFNLIANKATHNVPLVEMKLEDFHRPTDISMRTQFITGTAAGRVMMKQGSGIILSLTATPAGIGYPLVGGFGAACSAMEALTRGLGAELGPFGVRAVTIRSAGSPDSRPFKDAISENGDVPDLFADMKADTMLKELPLMNDIANTAVFLSSDMGAKITGVVIDITCGTTAALNYKTPKV